MNKQVTPEEIFEVIKPLDAILSDSSVWEIMIDSYDRMLVDRGEHVEQIESPFESADEYQAMIDALFGLYDITLNAGNPIGYLTFPDHSRCMAVVPPVANDGPYMVLRRIQGPSITWEDLINWKSVTPEIRELLKTAIEAPVNILVSGGTGSGKTTIARLIAQLIPPQERLIVAEKLYEIGEINHPRTIRLTSGQHGQVTFDEVLKAASRMRPDWLLVGELQGAEALQVLQTLGMGYSGITTIHSTGIEDALARLESMCLMANVGLGLGEIRQMIASSIKLLVHQERIRENRRVITDIVELLGVENHRYVLQPLFHYNPETDVSEPTGSKPSWEES